MQRSFTQLCGVSIVLISLMMALPVSAKTVEELREELQQKKSNLKSVEQRITKFKETIQLKKKEAQTLQGQIEIIDDSIGELELSIEQTIAESEQTTLEIAAVGEEVTLKEQEIAKEKNLLAEYIRAMHLLDQQSQITVFLKYATFSEVVSEVSTFTELQNRAQDSLNLVQNLHKELTEKRRDLEDYKVTLDALQNKQQQQQNTLETQQASKERILQLTKAQEQEYKNLLAEEQKTHKESESAISRLDAQIREELEKQGGGKLSAPGKFIWPIEPIFGVSCPFHCGGYPYAYLIGAHSGMDIPTYMGTPIKAPADGYIAKNHNARGPGYSYIMMIHGDNITTVYGHVSGFGANEGEFVKQGTVIGYTGGAAGANGSGLSTGPHLHFEVRQNNVAVNPQPFL